MENRNQYGVNVKIEPLAEKLLAVASAEGATVLDFALACDKAQKILGEKKQLIALKELLTSNSDESQCDVESTYKKGNDLEKWIEKILENIVKDLSKDFHKDELGPLELQIMYSRLEALHLALKISRSISHTELPSQ